MVVGNHGTKEIPILHFGLCKEILYWRKLIRASHGLGKDLLFKSRNKANIALVQEIFPFDLMLKIIVESNMINLKKMVNQTIIDSFGSIYF